MAGTIVITDSPTAEPTSPGVVVVRPSYDGTRKVIKYTPGGVARSVGKKKALLARERERWYLEQYKLRLAEQKAEQERIAYGKALLKAQEEKIAADAGDTEVIKSLRQLEMDNKVSPEESKVIRGQVQSGMVFRPSAVAGVQVGLEPRFKEITTNEVIEDEEEFKELGFEGEFDKPFTASITSYEMASPKSVLTPATGEAIVRRSMMDQGYSYEVANKAIELSQDKEMSRFGKNVRLAATMIGSDVKRVTSRWGGGERIEALGAGVAEGVSDVATFGGEVLGGVGDYFSKLSENPESTLEASKQTVMRVGDKVWDVFPATSNYLSGRDPVGSAVRVVREKGPGVIKSSAGAVEKFVLSEQIVPEPVVAASVFAAKPTTIKTVAEEGVKIAAMETVFRGVGLGRKGIRAANEAFERERFAAKIGRDSLDYVESGFVTNKNLAWVNDLLGKKGGTQLTISGKVARATDDSDKIIGRYSRITDEAESISGLKKPDVTPQRLLLSDETFMPSRIPKDESIGTIGGGGRSGVELYVDEFGNLQRREYILGPTSRETQPVTNIGVFGHGDSPTDYLKTDVKVASYDESINLLNPKPAETQKLLIEKEIYPKVLTTDPKYTTPLLDFKGKIVSPEFEGVKVVREYAPKGEFIIKSAIKEDKYFKQIIDYFSRVEYQTTLTEGLGLKVYEPGLLVGKSTGKTSEILKKGGIVYPEKNNLMLVKESTLGERQLTVKDSLFGYGKDKELSEEVFKFKDKKGGDLLFVKDTKIKGGRKRDRLILDFIEEEEEEITKSIFKDRFTNKKFYEYEMNRGNVKDTFYEKFYQGKPGSVGTSDTSNLGLGKRGLRDANSFYEKFGEDVKIGGRSSSRSGGAFALVFGDASEFETITGIKGVTKIEGSSRLRESSKVSQLLKQYQIGMSRTTGLSKNSFKRSNDLMSDYVNKPSKLKMPKTTPGSPKTPKPKDPIIRTPRTPRIRIPGIDEELKKKKAKRGYRRTYGTKLYNVKSINRIVRGVLK